MMCGGLWTRRRICEKCQRRVVAAQTGMLSQTSVSWDEGPSGRTTGMMAEGMKVSGRPLNQVCIWWVRWCHDWDRRSS